MEKDYYSLDQIEPKPRTYVRGILPRMLRMSDSVGTHSIHGLTSGDLRRYFKTKFKSYRKLSESNINKDEYLKFCDEIQLLPKEIVDKIQIEIQFVLMSADPEKGNPACYINLAKGIDKKKEGIIVLTPYIFMAPYVDKDGKLKQLDPFKIPYPILHEIAHHVLSHYKAKNKKDYDKNEKAAWELADEWFKQWNEARRSQRPEGMAPP